MTTWMVRPKKYKRIGRKSGSAGSGVIISSLVVRMSKEGCIPAHTTSIDETFHYGGGGFLKTPNAHGDHCYCEKCPKIQ